MKTFATYKQTFAKVPSGDITLYSVFMLPAENQREGTQILLLEEKELLNLHSALSNAIETYKLNQHEYNINTTRQTNTGTNSKP